MTITNDDLAEARDAGELSEDHEVDEIEDSLRSFVQQWWEDTDDTDEFVDNIAQWRRDIETLAGGDEASRDDPTAVTVQHTYRNAIQSTALVAPDKHYMRWITDEQVPAPDGGLGEAPIENVRFAKTLEILCRKYLNRANGHDVINSWEQDSMHFRMSILKCTFNREYATEQVTEGLRQPDAQDNLARARALMDQMAHGEFTEHDGAMEELKRLIEGIQSGTEPEVFAGLVLEAVPMNQFRIDGRIKDPANIYAAGWMSHDVLMTRGEIIGQWDIDPDELASAPTYRINGGVADEFVEEQRQRVEKDGRVFYANRDEDLLLVREIEWGAAKRVITLVRGMERPAADYTPKNRSKQWYSYILFIANRFPGRLAGVSDTELQEKVQRAMNMKRTHEEDARKAAQPRLIYDSAQVDEDAIKRIENAEPWSAIPLDLGGKDIKQAVMLLVGNHEYDPREYDTSKEERELSKMASLPSQATGVTNNADFSSEVHLAAAAMNATTVFRQNRMGGALERLYVHVAEILLQELTPDDAIADAGPHAIWPEQVPDRMTLFRGLKCDVRVSLHGQLEKEKRAKNILKLFEIMVTSAQPMNLEPMMRVLGRMLDEPQALSEVYLPRLDQGMNSVVRALQTQRPEDLDPAILQQFVNAVAPLIVKAVVETAPVGVGGAPVPGEQAIAG